MSSVLFDLKALPLRNCSAVDPEIGGKDRDQVPVLVARSRGEAAMKGNKLSDWTRNGPLVIGGVGGSGTRVLAEIVRRFGFEMGRDLNTASDNQIYTLMLKRPVWFRAHWRDRVAVEAALNVVEKLTATREPLSWRERRLMAEALLDIARSGHTRERGGAGGLWSLRRVLGALRKPESLVPPRGWGWKEPNSHLVLDHLAVWRPECRYIHLMRHGLDMAFSSNQQQVGNWAPLFGLPVPGSKEEAPVVAFRYWLRANDRVAKLGEMLGPQRFLTMKFEELCAEPVVAVERLAAFLGVPLTPDLLDEAAALPRRPASADRHIRRDLSIFDEADLAQLPRFGYPQPEK